MARRDGAVVNIIATKWAGETQRASALVAIHEVEALLAVSALDREAFVNVVLAVHSLETW